MERAGFEVRDVESLREHYSRTLRCWVANLEAHWDEAVALVGRARCRHLASVHGGIGHRVRGRRDRRAPGARAWSPAPDGTSGMPRTRGEWD